MIRITEVTRAPKRLNRLYPKVYRLSSSLFEIVSKKADMPIAIASPKSWIESARTALEPKIPPAINSTIA